jgi:hypothetical protein
MSRLLAAPLFCNGDLHYVAHSMQYFAGKPDASCAPNTALEVVVLAVAQETDRMASLTEEVLKKHAVIKVSPDMRNNLPCES